MYNLFIGSTYKTAIKIGENLTIKEVEKAILNYTESVIKQPLTYCLWETCGKGLEKIWTGQDNLFYYRYNLDQVDEEYTEFPVEDNRIKKERYDKDSSWNNIIIDFNGRHFNDLDDFVKFVNNYDLPLICRYYIPTMMFDAHGNQYPFTVDLFGSLTIGENKYLILRRNYGSNKSFFITDGRDLNRRAFIQIVKRG